MSAITVLSGAFATIILLGCAAVYVHDLVERRRERIVPHGGGGTRVEPLRPGPRPASRPYSAGKIVWVKAGAQPERPVKVLVEASTSGVDGRRDGGTRRPFGSIS